MEIAIRPLAELTDADAGIVGGKAASCARLLRAGFAVPDGLVVLPSATSTAIRALPTHSWIASLPPDATFAVRSSGLDEDGAGASFAGIHTTRLDVRREDLAAAVAACRASAFSPEAAEYRRARNLQPGSPGMAVLVQRMLHPVSAGVAFTINPVTNDEDQIVINASWGTAEPLVSGRLDPDEFIVRKGDGAIVWRRLGEKDAATPAHASLSDNRIRALGLLLRDVERHYGAPQDVEWCDAGTTFWIVQSRPITTHTAPAGETEWSRANLAEVLPDLTSPQALAGFEQLLNRAEDLYLGPLKRVEDGPFVKAFLGRLHFNLSMLRRICRLGVVPPAVMLQSMGHAGALRPEDTERPRLTLEHARFAPALLRMAFRHVRVRRYLARHDATIAALRRRLAETDAAALPDAELWRAISRWFDEAPGDMQVVLLLANVMFREMPLRRLCERMGASYERLVYPQLAAGERSVSAQQAWDLTALADRARDEPRASEYLATDGVDVPAMRRALAGTAFIAAFDRFLECYGHRGRFESDWALPRYREDPTPILRAVQRHLAEGPAAPLPDGDQRRAREAASAWAEFEDMLSPWQRVTVLPRARHAVRWIKRYYVWRERVRSDMAGVLEGLRAWHLELADRFASRGWLDARADYFFLRLEEIAPVALGTASPQQLRAIAERRRAEWERYRRIEMPLLMRESELPALVRTAGMTGGWNGEDALDGQPVSPGLVEGPVVVMHDPSDFARMTRGAILVARATDPSWTPLFTLAAGVIVEVGGVLSHASTIAREYGLPAIANVRQATKRLRTGERVRVDAYTGRIERLNATSSTG